MIRVSRMPLPGASHSENEEEENATIGTIGTKVNDLTVAERRRDNPIRTDCPNPQSWNDRDLVMPLRALLFDFDGVLADTENIHVAAWQRTFADLGWEVPDEVCAARPRRTTASSSPASSPRGRSRRRRRPAGPSASRRWRSPCSPTRPGSTRA